ARGEGRAVSRHPRWRPLHQAPRGGRERARNQAAHRRDPPDGRGEGDAEIAALRRSVAGLVLRHDTWLGLLGFVAALSVWHLTTVVLRLPLFDKIAPPLTVFREWFNHAPA